MEYLTVLFWSSVGSVFSLVGGVAMVSSARLRQLAVRFGLPFGAGALLAAAFVGVLPEAMHGMAASDALLFSLGGFLAFFMLERGLSWFHNHDHYHRSSRKHTEQRNRLHQWLVIIGDTLHNAIDGVAIGAAFLVNPAAGIGTAIAVAAHEIPQEIGDFSILLGKGMRPRMVILVNLLSALATVIAALSTFALGSALDINPAPLLAVAAGFFIYIAASDIIPGIHEKPRYEGNIQAAMLLVGVVLISIIIAANSHDHSLDRGHDNHSGDSHHEHDHYER